MLLHPSPILLIQLRPLGSKLDAPISGFHGTNPLRRRHDSFVRRTGLGILRLTAPASGRIPPSCPRGEVFTFGLARAHGARGHFLRGHETQETDQDGADFPGRIEALGVEITDGEAEAGGGLEAPAGGVHPDAGWGEGVVGREEERTPVLAAGVGGRGWAGDDVVPFEDIRFRGVSLYIRGWGGGYGCVFAG